MRSRFCQPKSQFLSLCITQVNYNPTVFCSKANKQRVDIHKSCRIFKNTKTKSNKYLTLEQVKKGKAPIRDHIMVASIDIIDQSKNRKKYLFNRPCSYMPDLPITQIFISLRNYTAHYDNKGYKLNEGDMIKIGNKRIRIIGISTNKKQIVNDQSIMVDQSVSFNQNQNRMTNNYQNQVSAQKIHRKYWDCYYQVHQLHEKGSCRICLSQQIDQMDFMMTPCQCKGSCATVHFSCLKQWVSQKVTSTTSRIGKLLTYSTKLLKCEICKNYLPKCIIQGANQDEYKYLFNMPQNTITPYLIAQIEGEPTLYLMKPKQSHQQSLKIVIGRSMTSDMVLTQNYVSKLHCEISYYPSSGQFFVKDLHSEIGTFVSLRENIQIGQKIQIEADGLLYEFKVEQNFTTFYC